MHTLIYGNQGFAMGNPEMFGTSSTLLIIYMLASLRFRQVDKTTKQDVMKKKVE